MIVMRVPGRFIGAVLCCFMLLLSSCAATEETESRKEEPAAASASAFQSQPVACKAGDNYYYIHYTGYKRGDPMTNKYCIMRLTPGGERTVVLAQPAMIRQLSAVDDKTLCLLTECREEGSDTYKEGNYLLNLENDIPRLSELVFPQQDWGYSASGVPLFLGNDVVFPVGHERYSSLWFRQAEGEAREIVEKTVAYFIYDGRIHSWVRENDGYGCSSCDLDGGNAVSAHKDNITYYLDNKEIVFPDYGLIIRQNGKEDIVLDEVPGPKHYSFEGYHDGWLFCSVYKGPNNAFVFVNTEDGTVKTVHQEAGNNVSILDDWVFFSSVKKQTQVMYRVRLDGTDLEELGL